MNIMSANAIERALCVAMERKKKFLIQWEVYGDVRAAVVDAYSREEAERICQQRSDEAHKRDRLIIAREYDPITDGDVNHE